MIILVPLALTEIPADKHQYQLIDSVHIFSGIQVRQGACAGQLCESPVDMRA
jgi:hypothetical protein